MRIQQEMLSQDITDWQRIDDMLNADTIEIQAEFIETKHNKAGQYFVGEDMTPWAYLEKHGVKPYAYFDFMWPSPWLMSPLRDAVGDPFWLRKKHITALRANPAWTRQSPDLSRPYSNPANKEYCDFLVDLLLSTGISRWRFDDCHIYKHSKDVNAGMFYIFDELRSLGCEVWANNAWEMDNPTDDPNTWGYPALNHLDGVSIEHWASHNDGIYYDGAWWSLTDERFQRVQKDWMDEGKGVMMAVRWRPNETIYDSYDLFCRNYIRMAKSIFVPCLYNYHYPNWLDWFDTYQKPALNIDEIIMRECDARQQIFLNVGAALQKVIHDEGGVPVQNEFRVTIDGVQYIAQKSEYTGVQLERYHYASVDNYNNIYSFSKPQ